MKTIREFQWSALASLILAGCGSQEVVGSIDLWHSGEEEREWTQVEYDTIWVWGGITDTLLAGPSQVSLTPAGGAVVLDVTTQRVHSFDGHGRLAWSWGKRGEGPGEIRNVRALAVAPSGNVIVVDSQNGRLIVLGPDGRLLSEANLEKPAYVNGVVVLREGQYVISTDEEHPWMLVDDRGRVLETLPIPWDGIAKMTFLQRNGQVVRWRDGAWVFGFGYGNGWFVFPELGLPRAHPYVEHTPFPKVVQSGTRQGMRVTTVTSFTKRPVSSAEKLSVVGDTLFVLFGGEAVGRVLDKYDLNTGAYLVSQAVPPISEMAVGRDGVVAVIDYTQLAPIVAMLRAKGEPVAFNPGEMGRN